MEIAAVSSVVPGPQSRTTPVGGGFGNVLADQLRFSGHAEKRLASRGIELSPEDLNLLNQGTAKAGAKGSQTALLLLRDLSFIVNVKNRTVVTALDTAAMKDGVVTNIDSTVLLK